MKIVNILLVIFIVFLLVSNTSACRCYRGKGYGYYCGYELGCGVDSIWWCPGYGAAARYVGLCYNCCAPPGKDSYCC
ncbi:hypothetical protein C2G38_2218815 [Gigaspora rosea]|uniref:Uncharacterized protein n=1 Tax=Gigaspora rosea TaxID=44941 RepID=A0A397U9J0_9GLOM|nr:hypothetical protein C2G38_2218815 [Gigaspora rosea]